HSRRVSCSTTKRAFYRNAFAGAAAAREQADGNGGHRFDEQNAPKSDCFVHKWRIIRAQLHSAAET
ncbi:MAG TPA: hypothetical protein PL117_17215, partial [Accumulibacter sp.]|uniref:hypothetical protein n=1 Tax=Accumulibacter sp. TaxID=2053492 RepID=UPI002B804D5C